LKNVFPTVVLKRHFKANSSVKKDLNSGNPFPVRPTKCIFGWHNHPEGNNLTETMLDNDLTISAMRKKNLLLMTVIRDFATTRKQALLVSVLICLISGMSTMAQDLQLDWTTDGSGSIRNLQNMTVDEATGDRYVIEQGSVYGFFGFDVAKYNDDGRLIWRTPYSPSIGYDLVNPVAIAYNAGAIFVLGTPNPPYLIVIKFSNDGDQLREASFGSFYPYYARAMVADPIGTGVIVTGVEHWSDSFSTERHYQMVTMKLGTDLNNIWTAERNLGFYDLQTPGASPRTITADVNGDTYITGVLDVSERPAGRWDFISPASSFTLKYDRDGNLAWFHNIAEPSITNYGYDNDYDATGAYMLHQRVPAHYTDTTPPVLTGRTTLTKRNLDGSIWSRQLPCRIREFTTHQSVDREVLAVDKITFSAYIAYDELSTSSVALEKYNAVGDRLWRQHISVGDSTLVQSVILDKNGNVVVGVNNGSVGTQYSLFSFTAGGHFISNIAEENKVLKQLLVDNHNHIEAIGTLSGSDSSYFVSRFSYEPNSHSSVPELLRPFEDFEVDFFAYDRGDCWTEININWTCFRPPYCTPPDMNASLSFQGKTLWESSFTKPISASLPQSKDFRTFSLKAKDGQAYKQVLLVDDKLVKNGVKRLSFKTNSVDKSVVLNLETDGAQIAVTVSMLNLQGKTLWTEQFMAPFQKKLSNEFNEPVAFISISGPADKASLTYYPNPSNGAFKVMLDPQLSLPAELTVYDMQGFQVHRQMIKESQAPINLSGQKAGLYVLRVKSGSNEIRELIHIK
jgi:hypothetical protein